MPLLHYTIAKAAEISYIHQRNNRAAPSGVSSLGHLAGAGSGGRVQRGTIPLLRDHAMRPAKHFGNSFKLGPLHGGLLHPHHWHCFLRL